MGEQCEVVRWWCVPEGFVIGSVLGVCDTRWGIVRGGRKRPVGYSVSRGELDRGGWRLGYLFCVVSGSGGANLLM